MRILGSPAAFAGRCLRDAAIGLLEALRAWTLRIDLGRAAA
jgi:hypothetical protein